MKTRKLITTSKLLLLVSYTISISLTGVVIAGTFLGFDVSNITTLAATSWLEVSATNVFYYNKAAKENVPKIISSIVQGLPEEIVERLDLNQIMYN